MSTKLVSFLFFLSLLILWQILAMLEIWPKYVMPGPIDVGKYLYKSMLDGSLFEVTFVTLKRLGLGYLMGLLIGIPLGLLLAKSKYM